MTKTYCDMCQKEINPFKSKELDTEWYDASSPTQWVHFTGDLCRECYAEREKLHAKLDTLILNRDWEDFDGSKADDVRKLLEHVEVWRDSSFDVSDNPGGAEW